MIAVTCRTGKHFSVDPDSIERIEHHGDTVLHLVDGTHYVLATEYEELLRTISVHRARGIVDRSRLVDGHAVTPGAPRLARRRSGAGGSALLT